MSYEPDLIIDANICLVVLVQSLEFVFFLENNFDRKIEKIMHEKETR